MRPSLLPLPFDEIPTGLEAAVSPSPSCDEGAGCCCAACRRKASSSLTFSCLLILATLLELFLRRRHRRQDGCPVNLATFLPLLALLGPRIPFSLLSPPQGHVLETANSLYLPPPSLVRFSRAAAAPCLLSRFSIYSSALSPIRNSGGGKGFLPVIKPDVLEIDAPNWA